MKKKKKKRGKKKKKKKKKKRNRNESYMNDFLSSPFSPVMTNLGSGSSAG